MNPARAVIFGAVCAGCLLRDRCTTARDGRSTTIHPHESLLRAARAQARTEEFKQAYPPRSSVERMIAWIDPERALGSGCATSALPRTMPGCTPGVPRSTCGSCCGTGWPAPAVPGVLT
jgi:hypothetical protein